MSLYSYTFFDENGKEQSLEKFKGNVLLIVNSATGCGFTPQYKDLEKLYKKYKTNGFEILDIPCNQFNNQAPGTLEEITEFCQLNYQTTFKQMSKADVNGENALPLYKYLNTIKPFEGFGRSGKALMLEAFLKMTKAQRKQVNEIKWNFTKFLVDREGNVVARLEPTHTIKTLESHIQKLL